MSYLKHNNVHNLWVANIGTIIDYSFFAYVYSKWELSATAKKLIFGSIPLFAVACITLMLYRGNFSEYETYTRPLASLVLLLLATVTLFRLSNNEHGSMVKDARFWISMGIVLSFGTTLILFSLSSVILELPMQVGRQLFYIHVIVTVLSQLIFAKSFLCQPLESSGQ